VTCTIESIGPAVKSKTKEGGMYRTVLFRGSDGKAYRTYISDRLRNYRQWETFLDKSREGTVLMNLTVKSGNIIDADSTPVEITC
jgi:hypothetical protein